MKTGTFVPNLLAPILRHNIVTPQRRTIFSYVLTQIFNWFHTVEFFMHHLSMQWIKLEHSFMRPQSGMSVSPSKPNSIGTPNSACTPYPCRINSKLTVGGIQIPSVDSCPVGLTFTLVTAKMKTIIFKARINYAPGVLLYSWSFPYASIAPASHPPSLLYRMRISSENF